MLRFLRRVVRSVGREKISLLIISVQCGKKNGDLLKGVLLRTLGVRLSVSVDCKGAAGAGGTLNCVTKET